MVFLGIEVNSLLMTLSIPGEKLAEIVRVLEEWMDKQRASLREVQQLAGLLNFAARCIRSGRVYLFQILNFLRSLPQTGYHKIPRETQLDIRWWKELAPQYNGVSLMLENDWSLPDSCISSDSCMVGGGVCTAEQYFHCKFSERVLQKCKHINELECVMLVVVVAKWASNFPRKRMQINCDNQVMVLAINSGSSCNKVLQSCLRYLHSVMALQNVDVKATFL